MKDLYLKNKSWLIWENEGDRTLIFISNSKVRDLITPGSYRLISLIGCMFKVIAKVLTHNLKSVIGSIFGYDKSSDIEG